MEKLFCDFTREERSIKPLCAFCSCRAEDLTEEYFTALSPKVISAGGEDLTVDALFPDLTADGESAGSYGLSPLLSLAKETKRVGASLYLRLALTERYAEAFAGNAEKWARVALFIVKALSENGCAPAYVEIAPYPDVSPESASLSDEKLYRLYGYAAHAVKTAFPGILVGGAGFASPVSDRVHAFLNNLLCDSGFIPLDFLSWRCACYKAEQLMNAVYAARVILDKYGFRDAKSVCSEWSLVKYPDDAKKNGSLRDSLTGASFYASCLAGIQRSPVDLAFISGNCEDGGLFGEKDGKTVRKNGYYPFFAFSLLEKCGTEVLCDTDADHLYVVGAKAEEGGIVAVSNYNPYETELHTARLYFTGISDTACEIYLIGGAHRMAKIYEGALPEKYVFPPETVTVIKVR